METPLVHSGNVCTWWKYCLRVDKNVFPGGPVELAKLLKAKGIASAPAIHPEAGVHACEVILKQRTFGESRWPFTLARPEAVDYSRAKFPGTFEALEGVLVLPWNEKYTDEHLEYIADSVKRSGGAVDVGLRIVKPSGIGECTSPTCQWSVVRPFFLLLPPDLVRIDCLTDDHGPIIRRKKK